MKQKVPAVGENAPQFTVLTADGDRFDLKSVLKSGRNLLLVFYRGHW